MPLPSLEYEEEDLFGSEGEVETNTAPPLPTSTLHGYSSAQPSAQAGPSRLGEQPTSSSTKGSLEKGKGPSSDVQTRLEQLRAKKRDHAMIEAWAGRGVGSLRGACMLVIRSNSSRIWDVGDMEYPMIRPFLDNLPQEQLSEIEENSPQIKKDTDWLWEVFLLEDYPLFHERCRERKGELRTTGWRRMYRKAKEDTQERQTLAKSRVAERYRQLEEEKAAKRIVVMDKVMAPTKKRVKMGGGGGGGGRSQSWGGGGGTAAPRNSTAAALAKARVDAQRARVALTHASGKYIPPAPSRSKANKSDTNDLFKNPYLEPPKQVTGPRLPPPRRVVRPSQQTSTGVSGRPNPLPNDELITGSYPTHLHNEKRIALPDHLHHRPPQPALPQERLRLPDRQPKVPLPIKRPSVQNFEPPKRKEPVAVDFFGDNLKDRKEKRKVGSDDGLTSPKRHRVNTAIPSSPALTQSLPSSPQFGAATRDIARLHPTGDSRDMSSVLFRKKAKPKPMPG